MRALTHLALLALTPAAAIAGGPNTEYVFVEDFSTVFGYLTTTGPLNSQTVDISVPGSSRLATLLQQVDTTVSVTANIGSTGLSYFGYGPTQGQVTLDYSFDTNIDLFGGAGASRYFLLELSSFSKPLGLFVTLEDDFGNTLTQSYQIAARTEWSQEWMDLSYFTLLGNDFDFSSVSGFNLALSPGTDDQFTLYRIKAAVDVHVVPEPATYALMGAGLLGIFLVTKGSRGRGKEGSSEGRAKVRTCERANVRR